MPRNQLHKFINIDYLVILLFDMITKIIVKNFRNLEHVDIDTSRITLLIGENASGKSGIIHSLLVLQQSFQHDPLTAQLNFSGELVNLGSFDEVVREHDESKIVSIGFEASVNASEFTNGMVTDEVSFKYVSEYGKHFQGCEMIVNVGKTIAQIQGKMENRQISATIDDNPVDLRILNDRGIGFDCTTNDEKFQKYHALISTGFVSQYLTKTLYFVPMPRGIGEFKTKTLATKSRRFVTSHGVAELTRSVLSSLAYDNRLVDRISNFTERLFGKKIRYSLLPYNLGEQPNYSQDEGVYGTVDFYDAKNRAFVSNEGFGLNQLLFLFTQVLDCPKGSTIFIEEPEISLHPSAQKGLIDILIEIAKEEDKQLIFTSHSEHIAFALFRAKDQGRLNVEDLVVYSFEINENKTSTPKKIENLHAGLSSFLGNDPSLILQYVEAFGKKDQWLESGSTSN